MKNSKVKKERKGINSNLIMVLAIPLLVAIGVLAGSYISGSNAQIISGQEAQQVTVPEATVTLDEFLLNLEPTNNKANYIRLEISLSSTQEAGSDKITANLDKIRDSVIHTVSRLTVDDVYNEEMSTKKLKDILKQSLNELFEDELVHNVYVTNIVVQ